MSGPRTRTALAVSTLLHAAVLGALVLSVRPPAVSVPLSVRLLRRAPEERGPGAEAAAVSGSAPAGTPPARWPASARKPLLTTDAMPTLAQALPPSGAVPAPTPPTLEAGPALASLEIGREGGSAAGAESSGAEGQGAVLQGSRLGELHHRLAEAAARCYPQAARRFRLQGEVPVHFCLDAAGTATALSLEGSTGSALLDRSALECVVQGAAPLSGFEGCFLVPVHFGG